MWDAKFAPTTGPIVLVASDGDAVRRGCLHDFTTCDSSEVLRKFKLMDKTASTGGVVQCFDLKHNLKRLRARDVSKKGVPYQQRDWRSTAIAIGSCFVGMTARRRRRTRAYFTWRTSAYIYLCIVSIYSYMLLFLVYIFIYCYFIHFGEQKSFCIVPEARGKRDSWSQRSVRCVRRGVLLLKPMMHKKHFVASLL